MARFARCGKQKNTGCPGTFVFQMNNEKIFTAIAFSHVLWFILVVYLTLKFN